MWLVWRLNYTTPRPILLKYRASQSSESLLQVCEPPSHDGFAIGFSAELPAESPEDGVRAQMLEVDSESAIGSSVRRSVKPSC